MRFEIGDIVCKVGISYTLRENKFYSVVSIDAETVTLHDTTTVFKSIVQQFPLNRLVGKKVTANVSNDEIDPTKPYIVDELEISDGVYIRVNGKHADVVIPIELITLYES